MSNPESFSDYKINSLSSISEALSLYMEKLEKIDIGSDVFLGRPILGFPPLKGLTSQLENSDFLNLVGQYSQSTAKSLINFLVYQKAVNVALFTIGTPKDVWAGEFLNSLCGFNISKTIAADKLNAFQWEVLKEHVGQLSEMPLFMNALTLNSAQITETIKEHHALNGDHHLDYIVIDFSNHNELQKVFSNKSLDEKDAFFIEFYMMQKELDTKVVLI